MRGKVSQEDGDVGIEVRVVVFPVPRLRACILHAIGTRMVDLTNRQL